MKSKSIWLIALVFGALAAVMLNIIVQEYQNTRQTEPVQPAIERTGLLKSEEEEPKKDMLPIPEGKRAMSITVSDVQGVAGFIEPGSHVDVVMIMDMPVERIEKQHDAATLLLQNVKVLALGHAADDEETTKRYQMVTLEVTPTEGLKLSFAAQYDLHLMLREEGDQSIVMEQTHVHEDHLHEGVSDEDE